MKQNTSKTLFNLLVSKDYTIKTLNKDGKEETNLDDVAMFSFDFYADKTNYGTVVILLNSSEELELFYGDNIGKTMENEAKKVWMDLLYQLRMFSKRNMLGFKIQNISKLKYAMQGMAQVNESFKYIFEGYYGTNKTSYNKQGNAKIVIKHNKKIGEDDKRYRYVESIFVENADGEKFKLPFTSIQGAKAMSRHVTEGGNPYDLFGTHISETVKDLNTLVGFVRQSKVLECDDNLSALASSGREHYKNMKKNLKQISGKRGYKQYKESWSPSEITDQDDDIIEMRELFGELRSNQKIEEAIPLLARLGIGVASSMLSDDQTQKQLDTLIHDSTKMTELTEFEDWADDQISDSELSIDDKEVFSEFMNTEQPLGIDAIEVVDQLYDIINDQSFFNELSVKSQEDPEMDARPLVKDWLDEHHPDLDINFQEDPSPEDDLSNSKETNESSELDRIVQLSK